MAVSYNRLWKLLIDKRISKAELRRMTGISPNTMTKLNRDEEIASFDKYVFGIPETIDPTENAVYVFGWQESSQFPKTEFEITRWGRYSVAVPKRK